MNLKEVFESSVNEMMDRIIDEESDLNNKDFEELFDTYFEEDFNSYYQWWSFNESELTIDNMNELLTCYSSLVSDGLVTQNDLSVEKLLRLYPHYQVSSLKDEFIQSLKEKIESSSNEESDNNTNSDA
jgi:hypothetical protein